MNPVTWNTHRECIAEYRAVTTYDLRRLIRVNALVLRFLAARPNATVSEYIAWRDKHRLVSYPRALNKIGTDGVRREAMQAYRRQVLAIYDRLNTL